MVCVAPLLICASASAYVVQFNENSIGLTWTLPAVTNLLADPEVTTNPANANVNNSSSNSWATLTDGLLPTVDPNPAGMLSVVAPNNNDEVVFTLDVAGNGGVGFNITSFDSYCHWNDGGRNDQRYTLAYSVVGDEANFIDIVTVNNNADGKSTHSRIYDTTGVMASNVAAVRVHFNGQENNWVGYSEFILSADPVVPAPVDSFTINESMTGQPTWTLPAGTNLLDGAAAASNPALQSPPPGAGNAVSTNWATMTNGAIGNSVDDAACCTPLTGSSVIFPLKNLVTNSKGYDLTSLDFYCAWADGGRKDMHFAVSYSTYDDPLTTGVDESLVFIPLGNVDNSGGGDSSTHSRMMPYSGFLASNVVAIKLNFRDQQNGWVGYREFIASGAASPLVDPLTWTGLDGSAGSATWIDGVDNNWTPGTFDALAPLTFDDTGTNTDINVSSALTASSLTFANDSTPYAFSGSKITVTNGVTSTGDGAATFANVVQATTGVALEGGGSLTFNGDLESDGLNLAGWGSITLNADNDDAGTPLFTGTAGMSDGTLNIANDLAVKSATLSMTGGTANFTTAAPFVANLSGSGGTVNLSATALTVGTGSLANQSTSFAGDISQASGTGSFIKDGASNLTLSGLNTYTGVTHVTGGTLQLALRQSLYGGTTASWTSGNLVVDSGATLGFNVGGFDEFDETDLDTVAMGGFANGSSLGINTTDPFPTTNFTLSRGLSGGAGLYKNGPAMLTLTGTNSNTGDTTISAGTLVAAGIGHVTLPGDVHMGDGSNNSVYMTFAADNQFGPTSVFHLNNPTFNNSNTKAQLRGTSQTIAGLDSPATAYISIVQNDDDSVPDYVENPGLTEASLTIDTPEFSFYSFRGIIRNQVGPALSVTKNGLGTQEFINLSGVQGYGYTGPTIVNAGTLRLNFGGGNTGFGSNITVNAPATLNFHAVGGNYAFDREISGDGHVVVDGTSAVIFRNGSNSFTNGITVDGGFLALDPITGTGEGTGPGGTCVAGAMDPANVLTVKNIGTLSLDHTAAFGNSGMLPQYASSIVIEEGSRIFGGTDTVAFVPNVTLDGGYIEITGGATTGGFNTDLALVGTVVVGGTSIVPASIFTNADYLPGGATPSANANVSLGSLGLLGTTFQVADVTGDPAADLTVSSLLQNVGGLASPLTKTGPGTMALDGVNTYTGATTISEGELRVTSGDAIADTNSVVIDGGQLGVVADETVGTLSYGAVQQDAGTYGSTGSAATFKDDTRFSGSAILTVTTGPDTDPYLLWAEVIPDAADRDKTADPDGDGFSNIEEFLFGTSPMVADGSLAQLENTGSGLILHWNERLDTGFYQLTESETMLDGSWFASGATITDGAVQDLPDYLRKEALIPIDSERKFVRVEAAE